ncbi:NADH-quinone oxidoreductase subunit J [Ferviditalea candida]|uniref:NADH-quinone oxidoreductase subunit J n=1 Tax=Ferviditalea candida TaxID=3108399 RepID=A0ABU5ZJ05_9BACL|nr:NADH-quinone oxidoreductase subunit J [Paenibacillaceae bacterium T2]
MNNFLQFFSQGENIAFAVFAVCIISGAIFMINFTKVVHMVLSLAFTFISLAGLYILLQAEFVAFVQVLIYAGAISILMIFGIMMTKHQTEEEQPKRPMHSLFLLIGVIGLLGILFYAIQNAPFPAPGNFQPGESNTQAIGELIFNQYVIPFELISVLLTVAFIGAIILAKREDE